MEPSQKSKFVAAMAAHSLLSGRRLLVLSFADDGLRLDEKAGHVTVGLRFVLSLCFPRTCPCSGSIDALIRRGTGPYAMTRHHVINDVAWRAVSPNTSCQRAFRFEPAGWQTARRTNSNPEA